MKVYFIFEEHDGFYELKAIAKNPEILTSNFGSEIVIYHCNWDTEEDYFGNSGLWDLPYEVYDVWSGTIKIEVELDDYFDSWAYFSKACEAYEEDTGEDVDWCVVFFETYADGELVETDRPDIEGLVNKLKSYLQ